MLRGGLLAEVSLLNGDPKAPESAPARLVSPDHLEIHRLAFDQGTQGLANQHDTLANIRQRAATLATLSAASAAFLGRDAFGRLGSTDHPLAIWQQTGVLVALLCLCSSILCVIQILRPRTGWVFYFTPSRIIDQFAHGDKATDLSRTYEVLARFTEKNYASNEVMLSRLFNWLWGGFLMVFLQIAAWLVAIAPPT